jgi:hypothetical protein
MFKISLITILITSIACFSAQPQEGQIKYIKKGNVSYFVHSSTNEAVFIQHSQDEYTLESSKNLEVEYDVSNGKIILSDKKTKEKVLFTTNPELLNDKNFSYSYLVMGLGHTFYADDATNDDGTISLACGCFNSTNPPMVSGQPASCANANATLSTGCSLTSSTGAGVTILGTGASGTGSNGCSVSCGNGAYSCCLESGSFDVNN